MRNGVMVGWIVEWYNDRVTNWQSDRLVDGQVELERDSGIEK